MRRSGPSGRSLRTGASRELVIAKVDGEPVAGSPRREALLAAGFVAGYRGLVLRVTPAPAERSDRARLRCGPIR